MGQETNKNQTKTPHRHYHIDVHKNLATKDLKKIPFTFLLFFEIDLSFFSESFLSPSNFFPDDLSIHDFLDDSRLFHLD